MGCGFNIGDNVVYPSHGVGFIEDVKVQNIAGVSLELLVIKFKDKMTLKIPMKKAENSGLRLISKSSDIDSVMKVLKDKPQKGSSVWAKRAAELELKVNSGDITLIAEVLRDLYPKMQNIDPNYSERVFFEKALDLLTSECAIAKNMTNIDAKDIILKELS